MKTSRNQLKQCASQIRKAHRLNQRPEKKYLEIIHDYRNSHKEIISAAFDELCGIAKKIHNNSVVVFRLKRIDTIERKLVRFETGLDRLQDIAGCRIIVDSVAQVNAIANKIKSSSKFRLLNETDYITNPRESGYKSFHLIVEMDDFQGKVEIQVRTRDHHYWATFVEITDYTYDVKLKEDDEHPDLLKLHQLLALSYEQDLTMEENEKIISIESELQIIRKVLEVFKHNYIRACRNWMNHSSKNGDLNVNYILLEIVDNEPRFHFFENFVKAEKMYFEKFTMEDETNMVIVNINDPDISKLFLAYSNYVLVSHPTITRLLKIHSKIIIDKKRQADFNRLKKLKSNYDDIVNYIQGGFENEELLMEKLNVKEVKEKDILLWYSDFSDRVEKISNDRKELDNKLVEITPKLTIASAWPRFKYWLNN